MQERKKIIVADDEADTLGFVAKILENAGYEVFSTQEGKAVVDMVKKTLPDLIILDLVMADMRGETIAASLAQSSETSGIPIIFMTALVPKVKDAAFKVRGKYRVLPKPVMVEELVDAVKKVLN